MGKTEVRKLYLCHLHGANDIYSQITHITLLAFVLLRGPEWGYLIAQIAKNCLKFQLLLRFEDNFV